MDVKKSLMNLQALLKKDKAIRILIIIGAIGVLLIYLSGFFGDTDEETPASAEGNILDVYEAEEKLESDLKKIVFAITGEEAEVMVTLENSGEITYASDLKESSKTDEEEEEKNYIVLKRSDGDQHGLEIDRLQPKVKGVVIVCRSAGNAIIKEKIIAAAKTVLNITSSRVCVVDSI